MKIRETATFKRYVIQCMVRMEMAKEIEDGLTEADRNPAMYKDTLALCRKHGLKTDGDILGKYYINAEYGVMYDLDPKKPDTDGDRTVIVGGVDCE